jgi:hypothetical protein
MKLEISQQLVGEKGSATRQVAFVGRKFHDLSPSQEGNIDRQVAFVDRNFHDLSHDLSPSPSHEGNIDR